MFNTNSNTMIILMLIGVIVIISVMYFLINTVYNSIRVSKLNDEELKFDSIRPIYKKLKLGELPNLKDIHKKSKKLEYRILIYDVLNLFDKINLFPNELLSIEKSSESYLSNWLDIHDEYEHSPDEITLNNKLDLSTETTVLIYNFKNYPEKKWMIAYVFYKTSCLKPYIKPNFIFSDFKTEILNINDIEKNYKQHYI